MGLLSKCTPLQVRTKNLRFKQAIIEGAECIYFVNIEGSVHLNDWPELVHSRKGTGSANSEWYDAQQLSKTPS